jgi:hypothetical protein
VSGFFCVGIGVNLSDKKIHTEASNGGQQLFKDKLPAASSGIQQYYTQKNVCATHYTQHHINFVDQKT